MKTQDVKLYAAQQLHRLQALPDNQRRAELAKLRRGIGHAPGDLPELWGSFLLEMPESFQGRSAPSAAEWAVYLALTLYAMHQQGNDRLMNCPGNTLGRAVRQLAERNSAGQDWTEASVLRRFNALATAEEITEISYHLRGMIQLLSAAKDGGIPLDYPQLAADLYELQCTDPRYAQTPANVRLRWGQDLYRDPKPAPDEPQQENRSSISACMLISTFCRPSRPAASTGMIPAAQKRQCTAVCSAPEFPHRRGSTPCALPLRRTPGWTWASALKRPQNW